jgi:hypothetical protein
MVIDLEVNMSADLAVDRLRSAINRGSRPQVAQRLKPHLDGDVSTDQVVLYRRRGSSVWYGIFRGRFLTDGSRVRLTGSFSRSSGAFVSALAGFAIAWAALLAFVTITRWQGAQSAAWLVAAFVAASIGVATFWFRALNAQAEAEILRSELASILGKHGA